MQWRSTIDIDIHVHAVGNESATEIVKQMDEVGLDKICLYAPPPNTAAMGSARSMRGHSDWLAKVAAYAPDRILPFAWIEPNLPDAVDAVTHAVVDLGFKGIKMIPNHWWPGDHDLFPVYERIAELNVPIVFHWGILYFHDDCSRYCRPVNYEPLLHIPQLRFALAHISWPWVDECLALFGRFRALTGGHFGDPNRIHQMWIDTCPGTPPAWRSEALRKAFSFAGDEYLLWGSDSVGDGLAQHAGEVLSGDRRILHQELGGSVETERRWMGENALRFLGIET